MYPGSNRVNFHLVTGFRPEAFSFDRGLNHPHITWMLYRLMASQVIFKKKITKTTYVIYAKGYFYSIIKRSNFIYYSHNSRAHLSKRR